MEKQVEYAGEGRRLLAYLIDTAITELFIYVLLTYVLAILMPQAGYFVEVMISIVLAASYFILFESSSMQATLGKEVLKLKVVTKKIEKIGWKESGLRYFCLAIPGFTAALPLLIYPEEFKELDSIDFEEDTPEHLEFASDLSLYAFALCIVLLIIWLAPIGKTKEKTGIHDMLSKTRVIRIRS